MSSLSIPFQDGNRLIFQIEAAVMLMSSRRGRARHDYHVERDPRAAWVPPGMADTAALNPTVTQLGDENTGPAPAASVIGSPTQPQAKLVTDAVLFVQTSLAQNPRLWGGTARALDVDEGSLVPVDRLRFHAAPLPPSDPAVPVEFGIATQP